MQYWPFPRARARPSGQRARIAVAVMACLFAVVAPARSQGTWQQTEFVIGTGNDPVTTSNTEESVRSVQFAKSAYFNLLTGTVAHTDDDHWRVFRNHPSWNAAKLDAAAKLGLKVFLANSAYTGALADDVPPHIGTWVPTLPRAVFDAYNETTADPARNDALWGYFLFDEPGPQANTPPWVKAWVDSIHDDDLRFPGTHHRAAFLNFTPGDTATMRAIANDPDPNRRLDVASLDLYPFGPQPGKPCPNQRWGYFAPQRRLKEVMGTRPYWVIALAAPALFDAASTYFCDPDAAQLRFMAFGAAVSGAKGIIWMGYRASYEYDSLPDPTYVLGDVDKPNCRYADIRELNHYLHDVVGPVVMANTHAGLFHEANGPHAEAPADMPLVAAAPAADCPATSLGNANFAVGVFRPPGAPDEYYLLVMNKALSAESGTVQLRTGYAVAAAPSVVGFVGGNAFSPLAEGASFPVALAGGEARLYHLSPSPAGAVALTSPAGGETWLPGETHTITWTPASASVDLTLLTSLRDSGTSLDGPAVPLARDVSGGSYTFQMPYVATRDAHVVLTAAGVTTHAAPLRTALPAPVGVATWVFGTAQCSGTGDLVMAPSGFPVAAYQTAPGRLEYRTYGNAVWSPPVAAAVEAGHEHWIAGYSARIAVAPDGSVHIAAAAGGVELSANARTQQHYFRTAQAETLEAVGDIAGASDLAIATLANGEVVVAGADSAGLIVRHRGANGWETWGAPVLLPDIRGVSLAVDANGNAWVAFTAAAAGGQRTLAVYEITPSASKVAYFGPGAWGALSLALDPSGRPAFACVVRRPGLGDQVMYTMKTASSWSAFQTADERPADITAIALAFNGTTPGIAYVANRVALHAARGQAGWNIETVHDGDAEGPIRLAYSPANGDWWVMYFDREADGMRIVGRGANTGGVCPTCPAKPTFAITMRARNPLRTGDTLEFDLRLPRPAAMAFTIFDVAGRRVATLPSRPYAAGEQRVAWAPRVAEPGAYFLRVDRDRQPVFRQRLILIR